jgi:branched-subunit amino acid aminotransferase/4-amino-4-deoxychorismate lyase
MSEFLNRAFMYGESIFTTMRMIEGEIKDWNEHFNRLRQGAEFIFGPFVEQENWHTLLKDRLEERFQHEVSNRILRVTLFREQERGLRAPLTQSVLDLKIALISTPYDPNSFVTQPLKLRTCPANPRPNWWPSYLKAGNYLETILAQKLFLQENDDDLLFLNAQDEVLESSVSNIFVIKNNRLYTAPLGPNVLDGVMRKKILDVAHDFFDKVQESATTMDQIFKADAVFGCNSVRGLFFIESIDNHNLAHTQESINKIEALKKRVFK